jgi:hypothetical protein
MKMKCASPTEAILPDPHADFDYLKYLFQADREENLLRYVFDEGAVFLLLST